ncbi:MAG: hypothetical protein ACXVP5_02865 [Tumebacillaceae bacterium]
MHTTLLQWGLFEFLIGLVLAVTLVPTKVFAVPGFTRVFINAAKLKSSHLDFFMQAFALCLAYLLEYATKTPFPMFIVVPLVYGSINNPLLFLYEATPMIMHPLGQKIFPIYMMSSCGSVLFAWGAIGYMLLPAYMGWLWMGVIGGGTILAVRYSLNKGKQVQEATHQIAA